VNCEKLKNEYNNLYQMQKLFNESRSLADLDKELNEKYCQKITYAVIKSEESNLNCYPKDAKIIIKWRSKETNALNKEEWFFENIYTLSY
jgi:predicted NUDIX family phosphoesterase